MKIVHNIKESTATEYVGRSVPRIYASIENRHVEHQSHMIEVEGKISIQPVVILIDSEAIHSYIVPDIVVIFHLKRENLEKSWLVQLSTRAKKRINDIVRSYPINLKEVNTIAYMNIIPLGSYDILIGMDWLEQCHAMSYRHNKTFTCVNEEGKQIIVKGIPSVGVTSHTPRIYFS
jgi:hypothetical protein